MGDFLCGGIGLFFQLCMGYTYSLEKEQPYISSTSSFSVSPFGDGKSNNVLCLVIQSCPTLCDPIDCSLPGSSVHGILQARILEWAAMSSSRGLCNTGIEPMSPTLQVDSLPSEPPGNPWSNNV